MHSRQGSIRHLASIRCNAVAGSTLKINVRGNPSLARQDFGTEVVLQGNLRQGVLQQLGVGGEARVFLRQADQLGADPSGNAAIVAPEEAGTLRCLENDLMATAGLRQRTGGAVVGVCGPGSSGLSSLLNNFVMLLNCVKSMDRSDPGSCLVAGEQDRSVYA
jgi:hypothetical protein